MNIYIRKQRYEEELHVVGTCDQNTILAKHREREKGLFCPHGGWSLGHMKSMYRLMCPVNRKKRNSLNWVLSDTNAGFLYTGWQHNCLHWSSGTYMIMMAFRSFLWVFLSMTWGSPCFPHQPPFVSLLIFYDAASWLWSIDCGCPYCSAGAVVGVAVSWQHAELWHSGVTAPLWGHNTLNMHVFWQLVSLCSEQ